MSTDPRDPRTFKTAKRGHMFSHLAKQPTATRSVLVAENDCRVNCRGLGPAKAVSGHWKRVATEENFEGRLLACDAETERQRVEAFYAEQRRASERHARALQGAMQTALISVRVGLESLATPAGLARLREAAESGVSGARAALSEAMRGASLLPELIQAERLVLGMTTEHLAVRDEIPANDWGMRVASDPVAVDLAQQLLDRVSTQQEPK